MTDTMSWAILKMILSFGIVCTILFFLIKLLRRSGWAKKDFPLNPGVRLLSTQLIAPQKYVSLIEIGGEILALGISESQITLLSKIENKEFLEKMVIPPQTKSEPFSLFHYFSSLSIRPKGLRMGRLRRFNGK